MLVLGIETTCVRALKDWRLVAGSLLLFGAGACNGSCRCGHDEGAPRVAEVYNIGFFVAGLFGNSRENTAKSISETAAGNWGHFYVRD